MLVHKFRNKYQGHNNLRTHSVATSVIDAEVDKFMETEKLNAQNLEGLEARISLGRPKG